MSSITVNVDDELKDRMERHPEINWSEVTRQAIQEKIETLEVMDELTSESELTESDVTEIADRINKSGRGRVEEQSD
jgi:phage terminase small subunit